MRAVVAASPRAKWLAVVQKRKVYFSVAEWDSLVFTMSCKLDNDREAVLFFERCVSQWVSEPTFDGCDYLVYLRPLPAVAA